MTFAAPGDVLQYHKQWIADFFHSFPHLDLSLEEANATFNPESELYIQALGFWAGIPLIWCALLWLAFLIFFSIRCCNKSQRKQHRSTTRACVCTGLFLLLGCGALATAFYGNAEVHQGVNDFVGAVKSANRTIEGSLDVINTLDRISENVETKGLPALTQAVSGITNATVHTKIGALIQQILSNLKTAESTIDSVRGDIRKVDTEEITTTAEVAEYYRWIGTIVLNCVYVFIFLVTFTALLKKSKWMLILVSVLSIIFMIAVWSSTSVYLFLGVGGGDLCVDPDSFVMSRVNGTLKQDVLQAYIQCTDSSKPYQGQILDAQTAVTQAITALNLTVNMSLPFNITGKISGPVKLIRNDLKFIFGNLSSLTTLIGSCGTIHNEYITAVKGVCISGLKGVGFLVLFLAVIGMTSALMVVGSALAWPYFGRRRRGRSQDYTRVDDTDPFLPDPPPYQRNYGTIMPAPPSDRGTQSGAVTINEEDRPIMNLGPERESPPPAYHPGHYMQQYYSLAPTPRCVAQSSNSTT